MRSFKRWIWAAIFLAAAVGLNWILNCALYPYTYARVDVHNLETNSYDDIFVGSSHGKSGINPLVVDEVTGRKSTNLCLGGQYPIDSYYIVKEAVRVHPPKRIIYELDPGYWMGKIGENFSFGQTYYELPPSMVKLEYFKDKIMGRDMRNTLFPWYLFRSEYPNFLSNIKMKFSVEYKTWGVESFDKGGQRYEAEGFINRDPIPNENKQEDNLVLWDRGLLNEDSMKYFEKMQKLCEQERIELVVITTPVPKVTLEKHEKEFRQAYSFLESYMKERDAVYINFNYEEEVDVRLDAFGDYDGHMHGEAANRFSKILGAYLKEIEEKKVM